MERIPFGVLLAAASVIVLFRQWRTWSVRAAAVSRWDRAAAHAAPAYAACSGLTAVLGLAVAVTGATGAGPGLPRLLIAVVAGAVVVTLVVHAVLWWRAGRTRPAPVPPPVVGTPPVVPAGWAPPTPQAAAMIDARRSGDPAAVCAALAMEPLLVVVAREDAGRWFDRGPGPLPPRGERTPDGRFHVLAYTEGGAPPTLGPDRVLRSECLDEQLSGLTEAGTLDVDPGTPQQVSVDLAVVRNWTTAHPDRVGRGARPRLRALAPASLTTPLDHGLACAAWHAVMNGYPWNRLGPRGHDHLAARLLMRRGWGIETARDWQQMLDRLADPQPFGADVVFDLRRRIGGGAFVPGEAVASVVEAPENVAGNGRETTDAVLADLRRTEAYEGYLREHAVLAEWEQVHSLLAWDIGRGAMLARYGLDADYCDHSTARWQLERFGLLARRCYDSWPEFGAALVLGRLLWTADLDDAELDQVAFEARISVEPFTILTTEPTSPWRTVPFHPVVAAQPSTSEAG